MRASRVGFSDGGAEVGKCHPRAKLGSGKRAITLDLNVLQQRYNVINEWTMSAKEVSIGRL